MFKVIDKITGEIHTVYGMNGTHFLIYNSELDWWFYKNMEECRPCITQNEGNWLVKNESCND